MIKVSGQSICLFFLIGMTLSCGDSKIFRNSLPQKTPQTDQQVPKRPAHGSIEVLLKEVMNENRQTDAFLLMQDGKILVEAYDHGYNAEMPHKLWSVSKTLSYLALGAAVNTGRVQWDQSICDFFPNLRAEQCQLTLKHLATHSSGLDWKEAYEKSEDLTASSVVQLLFGDGRLDRSKFILQHPFAEVPGTTFRYSTGDTTLLMAALKAAFPESGNAFVWKNLFHPLGIESLFWETDSVGTLLGGAGAYATARELGKIGQLMLNEGRWKDQQILPANWIQQGSQVSEAFKNRLAIRPEGFPHGATLWLNQDVAEQDIAAPFQEIDRDVYWAWGHWGQFVVVFPSLGAVAVRLGNDRNDSTQVLHSFLNASQNFLKGESQTMVSSEQMQNLTLEKWTDETALKKRQKYSSSRAKIAVNTVAQELCNCLFLVGQSQDYCHHWVREGLPVEVPYTVNLQEKSVDATLKVAGIVFWRGRSRFEVSHQVANTSSCRAL